MWDGIKEGEGIKKEKVIRLTTKIRRFHGNVLMDIEQSLCDIWLSEICIGGTLLADLGTKVIKFQKLFILCILSSPSPVLAEIN